MDSTTSWLAVLGLALGTFAIRYSFIGLFAKRDMPAWLHRALGLMVPAIFMAIVCSGVALVAVQVAGHTSMQVAGLTQWPRYAAALVALAVALRTQGNLLATVVAGMAALHGLPWVLARLI